MIFDTHAHYDDEAFDEDREELLASLREHGIEAVVNVGASIAGTKRTLELTRRWPFFYGAVGVHPNETAELDEEKLEWLKQVSAEPKVVAIGEIGLDYYWPEPSREVQQRAFRLQLDAARQLDLPVIIHSRDAAEDTVRILREFPGVRGVIHCFTGSAETARILVEMGFYIGFTGVLTFQNSRRPVEACKAVPLDRILLETDCPYMAPVPYRGKRCWSPMIARTAERAAEIKGIDPQQMIDIALENTKRLFGL